MATYTAPFQRDAISEVVPRALELSSLSKSSLLTGRRRIRVIPQTGQTYGGPSPSGGGGQPTIANILLQDSAGLLDMQSVVLSMNLRVYNTSVGKPSNAVYQASLPTNNTTPSARFNGNPPTVLPVDVDPYIAAACSTAQSGLSTGAAPPNVSSLPVQGSNLLTLDYADNVALGSANPMTLLASSVDPLRTAVLDDFAWSVFRRIQISLNSQLVDDLDYCGRRATTEVYMSASPDWYQTIGTVMGAWKYVPTAAVQGLLLKPRANTTLMNVATPGAVTSAATAVASYPLKSAIDVMRFANLLAPATAALNFAANPLLNTNQAVAPTLGQPFSEIDGTTFNGAPISAFRQNIAVFFPETLESAGSQDRVLRVTGSVPVFDVSQYYPSSVSTTILGRMTYTGPVGGPFEPSGFTWINGGGVGENQLEIVINEGSSALAIGGVDAGVPILWQPGNVNFSLADTSVYARVAPVFGSGITGSGPSLNPVALLSPYIAANQNPGLNSTGQALAGVPYAIGSVAREDVMGKLYNASMFFKGVYFLPRGSTSTPSSWYAPRLQHDSVTPAATNALWKENDGQGFKFSIPMGLLSHLFRQEQLFPLRNAGQLIMQIQFADPVECCFGAPAVFQNAGGGNHISSLTQNCGTPVLTYTASELELECDIVTAIPEYTAILDSICSRPADKGLAIAFDSHLSSLQQVTGTGSTGTPNVAYGAGNQSFTLIASKGSENVRSFHFTLSPTAGLRNFEYLQNSTFPAYDMTQWQLRVGSVYYPAFPSKGLSKNYMEMLSSVNAPMPSVGQASIVNYNMFRASTPSPSWVIASGKAPLEDGLIYSWDCGAFSSLAARSGAVAIDAQCSAFSDGYIGGYCFDNLKHAEPLSHDGLDTRAIAGGMIQLDFQCTPLEPFAVVFHIRFTRTIVLAENGVSIVG